MSASAGRPHRGRRDNGLDAPEFVALADVDPRIGEHLLDVLGVVGIAAYLAPSADLNPVVRATTLPARPTDRLWVDRERLDEARGLYEAVQEDEAASAAPAQPSTPVRRLEVDVDAEWERIVAGYDATAVPDRTRRHALAEPAEPNPGPEPPEGGRPDAERSEADRSESAGRSEVAAADPQTEALPVRRPGSADPVAGFPREDGSPVEDARPGGDVNPVEDPTRPTETPTATADPASKPAPYPDPPGLDPPRPTNDQPRSERDHPAPPPEAGPEPGGSPASGPTASRDRPGGLIGPVSSVDRLGFVGRDRLTGTDAPPSDFDLDESDEGYDPPPPPPLPRLSLPVVLAVLAIAAGLILLFRSDTLGLGEQARLLLALCGILGGAGALVWRLRDSWDENDPEDGAVV